MFPTVVSTLTQTTRFHWQPVIRSYPPSETQQSSISKIKSDSILKYIISESQSDSVPVDVKLIFLNRFLIKF